MKRFLAIDIKLPDDTYKLISVTVGSDNSLYFHNSSNNFIKENIGENAPIKFSYHNSGKSHLTFGSEGKRLVTIPFPKNIPLDNLTGIIGTHYMMSFWDINTINANKKILDKSNGRNKYAHKFIIEGENYKNLTITFGLANKNVEMKFENRYKEWRKFELEKFDLLVGINDEWRGKEQVKGKNTNNE